jgi:putative transcriptional regulator
MSKIIDSLKGDMRALAESGAISKTTLRDFEVSTVARVDSFGADRIKALRESLQISQPVFAMHLHTTASTVRKWEQGTTQPTGPALLLLNVVARKGLEALA